jgi:hypothetical protein
MGEQLADASIIGPFDLVLDQNPFTNSGVLAENVSAERIYELLLRFEFYANSDSFTASPAV